MRKYKPRSRQEVIARLSTDALRNLLETSRNDLRGAMARLEYKGPENADRPESRHVRHLADLCKRNLKEISHELARRAAQGEHTQ